MANPFRSTVYVRIKPDRLSVLHLESGNEHSDVPAIAIEQKNGKPLIIAVGPSPRTLGGRVMGLDIQWVFQRNVDSSWVDIACDYQGDRDYVLYSWLGLGGGDKMGTCTIEPLAPLRGLPEDFEVVDKLWHPTSIPNRNSGIAKYSDCIFMGESAHSWLLVSEILQSPIPSVVRTVRIPTDEYLNWDDQEYLPWQWAIPSFGHVVGMPDRIVTTENEVLVEWDYDFSEDFSYFINQLRQLV